MKAVENLATNDLEKVDEVSLHDMLSSLSTALDLIDLNLYDHHNRVCYI